ncbi:DUF4349 domain-containing protein [Herbivorax sp. ANBcel31]|uniref:DUF4349 domain-containing protein n=1 Tax=Herbivorax sp. ANBcel31 TaxID=3069754 RepID=UPI0027B38EDB|nr:DUF4349 domain-containing protein [Herbivorax sp. ANBcel31]MDQ2087279.1 DUF4349 domain-containing protein [Herbivorax sp. ANBcel31]
MKTIKLASVFFVITLLLLTIGCSSSEPEHLDAADSSYNDQVVESRALTEDVASESEPTALVTTGTSTVSSANKILDERKIVRNANITLEVDDFEKSYGKIEYFISGIGFVQESRINKDKRYVDSKEILITRGVIILRVDASKFNTVLKDVKGLGLLTEENIKTDDVTEKFFDVESRLRLVRNQERRLEEYIETVDDPEIVFKTEDQLTDIRHEIERLTGTLNKLNDLVELSTITINMEETLPVSEEKEEEEKSYLEQLKSTFLNSFEGVLNFCASFIMGVVAVLPALVLLGIIFTIVLFIYKKFFKNRLKKSSNEDSDISG